MKVRKKLETWIEMAQLYFVQEGEKRKNLTKKVDNYGVLYKATYWIIDPDLDQ